MKGIIEMINKQFMKRELLSNKDKLNEFFLKSGKNLTKDDLVSIIMDLIEKNAEQENFCLIFLMI